MNKKRVNLYLDPELITRAKAQAAKEGTTLTEVINASLKHALPPFIVVGEESIGEQESYQDYLKKQK